MPQLPPRFWTLVSEQNTTSGLHIRTYVRELEHGTLFHTVSVISDSVSSHLIFVPRPVPRDDPGVSRGATR